jgi:hypothetical protein
MGRGPQCTDHRCVSPALVTCHGCGFHWHSESMAHGLRVLGHCVRCNGELEFAAGAGERAPDDRLQVLRGTAPHIALGAGH